MSANADHISHLSLWNYASLATSTVGKGKICHTCCSLSGGAMSKHRKSVVVLAALTMVFTAWGISGSAIAAEAAYDLLLRNARIVDGTGNPWFRGDLAVRGDTIVQIAPSITAPARRVLDLKGAVALPASSTCILTRGPESLKYRRPTITFVRVLPRSWKGPTVRDLRWPGVHRYR